VLRFFNIVIIVVLTYTASLQTAYSLTITDQLVKLSDLYTKGLITKDEFNKAKSIILKMEEQQQAKIEKIEEKKKEIQLASLSQDTSVKKKKTVPKLSAIGEVKLRRFGQTKASIGSNKAFEKMEMVIGNYRFYTHRPGAIKVLRLSDKKQLAVIGDNLNVKFYNNGSDDFEVIQNKKDLELIFKLNGIGVLVWQGRYIQEHEAHFYQVLSMGSKPFHYYAKTDIANNAVALNMEAFDKKIEKAIERVKISLAAEHNMTIAQIEQVMLNREAKAANKLAKKLNLETNKAIDDALDAGISEELTDALEATLGRQLAEGFVEGIEEAFGNQLDAQLDEALKHELAGELDTAINEAIEEAISQGISQAAIEAGLMAFFEALASGATFEEALAAGDAACQC